MPPPEPRPPDCRLVSTGSGFLLLLLSLASVPTGAAGPLPLYGDAKPYEFDLRLARNRNDLDYGNSLIATTTERIGVTWRERVFPRLYLGMFGGYSFTSQTNNASTAGLELDGYHAGLSLHLVLFESRRVNLFFSADYTYESVDHDSGTQAVNIDWYSPGAQLGAIFAVGGAVRIYGGGRYGYTDGKERLQGVINQTTPFARRIRTGALAGLDIDVKNDGYIGIETRSGINRGGEIYFKRRF